MSGSVWWRQQGGSPDCSTAATSVLPGRLRELRMWHYQKGWRQAQLSGSQRGCRAPCPVPQSLPQAAAGTSSSRQMPPCILCIYYKY
eukprot:COSAG01_NODE_2838_length_6992_cov_21.639779_4_plen_87_part_00